MWAIESSVARSAALLVVGAKKTVLAHSKHAHAAGQLSRQNLEFEQLCLAAFSTFDKVEWIICTTLGAPIGSSYCLICISYLTHVCHEYY